MPATLHLGENVLVMLLLFLLVSVVGRGWDYFPSVVSALSPTSWASRGSDGATRVASRPLAGVCPGSLLQ